MGLLSTWLSSAPKPLDIAKPHLELCGEALGGALQDLVSGAEEQGGIELYVQAVKLKSALFKEVFSGNMAELETEQLLQVCTFMPTVRRRIAPYLDGKGLTKVRDALAGLLADMKKVDACDARIAAFCAQFPHDKEHRFIRDLAAEALHYLDPERYPMMMRWIWDAKSNTGVIREIWFGEDVDHITIPVADDLATFLMLREELAQFLSGQGFFRDVPEYIDVLCAQIYANYICAQGGTYLRTDFSAPEDPMQHTRRLLGLDGVRPGSSRTRLKAIDGSAYVIEDISLIS